MKLLIYSLIISVCFTFPLSGKNNGDTKKMKSLITVILKDWNTPKLWAPTIILSIDFNGVVFDNDFPTKGIIDANYSFAKNLALIQTFQILVTKS